MPKRFTATENAIEKGLDTQSPSAGAKLVQGWIEALEGEEFSGAKGIARDLQRLHKELDSGEPDSEAVEKLLGKLGAATTKAGGRAEDDKIGGKVTALGEALTNHGGDHVVEEDDED